MNQGLATPWAVRVCRVGAAHLRSYALFRIDIRQCLELSQQVALIPDGPVLGELPVMVEALDYDQLPGGLPSGRLKAEEGPQVCAPEREPLHYAVALRDFVL